MVIRTRPGRVTVNESEISAAFREAWGDVHQNMKRFSIYHLSVVQKNAPTRTGNMVRMISRSRVRPAFNRYSTMYTLDNHADYAIYTLVDTGPWITSNRGLVNTKYGPRAAAMGVRPAPFSRYAEKTPRTAVRGYPGRDWMGQGTRAAFIGAGLGA